VYAGDLHAEQYVAFLADYLGARPSVCNKMTRAPSRCKALTTMPHAASCPTFGKAPMNPSA
jgi:hypothetical protein